MLNYYVSLLGKVNLMELLNLTLLKVKLFFFENNSVTHQRIMIKKDYNPANPHYSINHLNLIGDLELVHISKHPASLY